MNPRRLTFVLLAAAALLPALPGVGTCSPRDKLLRLVPDDMALVMVVNNLRGHAGKWLSPEALGRWQKTPLGQALLDSKEAKQLRDVDASLRQYFGITSEQLRDDILGDAAVFAFHHGGEPKKDERGLVLVWARNPQLLARVIARLNDLQKKSGDLVDLSERKHRDVVYHCRVEKKGDHQFYFQKGPLLAFSNSEALLKQAIDRHVTPATEPPIVRSFRALGHDHAVFTFWINPRAFDKELEEKAEQETRFTEKQVLAAFARYWRASDAFALSLAVDRDAELLLTLQGREKDLPAAARKLFAGSLASPDLWSRFPEDAALAAACRLDFPAALETLEEFLTPKERDEMRKALQKLGAFRGLDFLGDVLPHLGPDAGLFVAAAPRDGDFPHGLVALRVQPGPKEAPVEEAVRSTVSFYVNAALLSYNLPQKPENMIRLKTRQQGGVEVKYLESRQFPPGFQPCYALKDGYLLLATSPDAVARFRKSAVAAGPPPLLRVSFPQTAKLLQQHRGVLVPTVAAKNQVTEEKARQWLDSVAALLQSLERFEIDQQAAPGQVTWRLRLALAGP